MAKKPAITGVARPQGFIDDAAKVIGRALRKPKSVSVTKQVKRITSSKDLEVKKAIDKALRSTGLPKRTIKIDSKPKSYTETYMKGTKEYKDAIKASRVKSKSLKDINKYDAARSRRAQEYKVAKFADESVKYVEKNFGKPFTGGPEKDYVRKFIKMSPKKVKSGKR